MTQYPEQNPALSGNAFHSWSVTQQVDAVMHRYLDKIWFIQGWIDAEREIEVLFSTFEDYATDRDGFLERYLAFYGGARECFSYDNAFALHPGTDYHFRAGLIDEWRSVFPPEQAQRLSAWIPDGIKRRFGWPD